MPLLETKRSVVFAGENHMITLYGRGSGEAVACASCWRCTYSAEGEGWVLLLWHEMAVDHDTLAPQAIFSDNPAMGQMVTTQFNQYFDGFRDRGFTTLAPQPARFSQQADGRRLHRISCASAAVHVELVWRDVFDAALEIFDNTSGPQPYDVSAVICHCAKADILVDGDSIPGEVRRPAGDSASSAFLAFSETWVER